MFKNKKAVVGIFTILAFIVVALLGIYLLLYLPIPAFVKLRALMNYIMIVLIWFVFQIALIYGYFYLGKLAIKGFNLYRDKLLSWTFKVKSFLITRGR